MRVADQEEPAEPGVTAKNRSHARRRLRISVFAPLQPPVFSRGHGNADPYRNFKPELLSRSRLERISRK